MVRKLTLGVARVARPHSRCSLRSQLTDDESGDHYYYHTATGKTSWQRPK